MGWRRAGGGITIHYTKFEKTTTNIHVQKQVFLFYILFHKMTKLNLSFLE